MEGSSGDASGLSVELATTKLLVADEDEGREGSSVCDDIISEKHASVQSKKPTGQYSRHATI